VLTEPVLEAVALAPPPPPPVILTVGVDSYPLPRFVTSILSIIPVIIVWALAPLPTPLIRIDGDVA